MLLKALYDVGIERLDDIHLQRRRVHILIPLTRDGDLRSSGVLPLNSKDRSGKSVLGEESLWPRFPGENNGGKAYFLAESVTAVLGIETPSGAGLAMPKEPKGNTSKSFQHFWRQIETAHETTELPELRALICFRERFLHIGDGKIQHSLPFIEKRETETKKKKQSAVCARSISGDWIPLENLTISFEVEGHPVFQPNPNRPLCQYWKRNYHKLAFVDDSESTSSKRGLCIVTEATDKVIARSHKPKILGVPGLSSGGYVVSFARECPSFSSYGFEMGENAPVSEVAAAAYALGLQTLLDSENNSLRIGPAAVCFWTKKDKERPKLISRLLNKADPKGVADFLKSPWKGIEQHLAKKDQLYSVTLSGNAGRVVVRHWLQITLAAAIENLQTWFNDLEITPLRSQPDQAPDGKNKKDDKKTPESEKKFHPMALFPLACATVRDTKGLRGETTVELYRAAIEGKTPSVMLLKDILDEFGNALVGDSSLKPRYPFNQSRFALLRLILNRNRKGNEPMIEPQVFETDDEAYNCGRLLAVLAEAQERAHEFKLEGAGIAERYFGAASVAPCSVLPLLIRLNRHHLEKMRKSDKYRSHVPYIEAEIQNIMALLVSRIAGKPPEFPRYLDLKKQGRFAIGFYQQKAKAGAEREAWLENNKKKSALPEEAPK
jgi:CRISPR-associated protein Csd1